MLRIAFLAWATGSALIKGIGDTTSFLFLGAATTMPTVIRSQALMQTRNTIHTDLGILWGRDCVFLDSVSMPDMTTLRLHGSINANIVRDFCAPDGWSKSDEIPYVFTFLRCLGYRVLELDTWDSQNDDTNAFLDSSFQEIVNSKWLASLAGKRDHSHRHFQLATYDEVFDIICSDYNLSFGNDVG